MDNNCKSYYVETSKDPKIIDCKDSSGKYIPTFYYENVCLCCGNKTWITGSHAKRQSRKRKIEQLKKPRQ